MTSWWHGNQAAPGAQGVGTWGAESAAPGQRPAMNGAPTAQSSAMRNARLALARLTESIQSIAHPSAQESLLVSKAYTSEQEEEVRSVTAEARLFSYLLHAAIQDGQALGIIKGGARGPRGPGEGPQEGMLTNGGLIPFLMPVTEALQSAYPSITHDMPPLGPSLTPGSAPWPSVLLVIREPDVALRAVTCARAACLGVVLVRTALQALTDITEGLSSVTGYQAVITEAYFPYMGGLEFVTRLRRDGGPEWRTKPIILVHGDHPEQPLLPDASRRAGASEFVGSFEQINFPALRATILQQPPSLYPAPPAPPPPYVCTESPIPVPAPHVPPPPPPPPPLPSVLSSSSSSAPCCNAIANGPPNGSGNGNGPLLPCNGPPRLPEEPGHWVHSEGDEAEGDNQYENDSGSDGGRSNNGTKRVKRACSYCHHKKVMCSGERPCTRCTSLNIRCTEYKPKPRLGKRQAPGSSSLAPRHTHSSSMAPQITASGTRPSMQASTGLPPWSKPSPPLSPSSLDMTLTLRPSKPPPSHPKPPSRPLPDFPITITPQQSTSPRHPHPTPAPPPPSLPPPPPSSSSPTPTVAEMQNGLDRLGVKGSHHDPSMSFLRNYLLQNPELYSAYVRAHKDGRVAEFDCGEGPGALPMMDPKSQHPQQQYNNDHANGQNNGNEHQHQQQQHQQQQRYHMAPSPNGEQQQQPQQWRFGQGQVRGGMPPR